MTRAVALLCLLSLGLTACDARDVDSDTRSDTERLIGSWSAATADVRVQGLPLGIPVADLAAQGDEQTIALQSDGTFRFRFDPADGRRVTIAYQGREYVSFPLDQTVALSGTYTVDESAETIRFSTVAGQTADDFSTGYAFGSVSGRDSFALVVNDPETLGRLFGIARPDLARVASVVSGGQITYTQAGA